MINKNIAKEYIDTLGQFPNYQISIYDSYAKKIGSTSNTKNCFSQEELQNFLNSNESVLECKKDSLNCVLVKIYEDNITSCFIAIAGSDNNLLPIATALKMSLEIRLKYEQIQTEEKETLTINEQLIKELVSNSLQVSKIIELCEQSNHSMEIERKMIMLIPDDVSSLDVLANMNLYYDSKEDIVGRLGHQLIILKDMSRAIGSEKDYIKVYFDFLIKNTSFKGKALVAYTSKTYDNVKFAYQNLTWLKKYTTVHNIQETILFFSNYVDMYCISSIPYDILRNLFSSYTYNEEDAKEFITTTDALIRNNYNIVRSSKELFVHKNTLMYRLTKIKNEFDIDPINSESDCSFIKIYNYYLKHKIETKGDSNDERN